MGFPVAVGAIQAVPATAAESSFAIKPLSRAGPDLVDRFRLGIGAI